MSAKRHPLTLGICAVLTIALGSGGIDAALASKPVPKTIVGCVIGGSFVSSDGYDIHPRQANGEAIDLHSFEGHSLTISGNLLPGDALIVNKPLRDGGRCRTTQPAAK